MLELSKNNPINYVHNLGGFYAIFLLNFLYKKNKMNIKVRTIIKFKICCLGTKKS